MENSKDLARWVVAYLDVVKEEVAKLHNPKPPHDPVQIPYFDQLRTAAQSLDTTLYPEKFMFMIQQLLGRAGDVDTDMVKELSFPADHSLHPLMGLEWYYIACNLEVEDEAGHCGRMGLLMALDKMRAVGLTTQKAAGWSDQDTIVASSVTTATVTMDSGENYFHSSKDNLQWNLNGGKVSFSKPGEPFAFVCGEDSLKGSVDVLPLQVRIKEPDGIEVNLLLDALPQFDQNKAFFLQGMPKLLVGAPTGLTPKPVPGLYYSWPQLCIEGNVKIGAKSYTITGGKGWMDHQLLGQSLSNPFYKRHSVPFIDQPEPYDGWIWQFFNLEGDHHQAFTVAGFFQGEMPASIDKVFGYLVEPKRDHRTGKYEWDTHLIYHGTIGFANPVQLVEPGLQGETRNAILPTERTYSKLGNPLFMKAIQGKAIAWKPVGIFPTPGGAIFGEFPSDFSDTSGHYANGAGFMESVGFETVNNYEDYYLGFLRTYA